MGPTGGETKSEKDLDKWFGDEIFGAKSPSFGTIVKFNFANMTTKMYLGWVNGTFFKFKVLSNASPYNCFCILIHK